MKQINFFIGTLSTGGAERAVSNISSNLSEQYKKDITLYGSKSKIVYPYKGNIVQLDRINHDKGFLYKLYALFYRVKEIRKIKKVNPNLNVISFLEYPNMINLMSKNKGKTIVSVRNHMSTKLKGGFKNKVWNFTIRKLYSKADIVVAVSKEIKKDLIDNYKIDKEKIVVIYNSYNLNEIQTLSKEPIDDTYDYIFDKPVIITVGRLNRQKGQWHLIRVFSELKKTQPELRLVILGEGKLEKNLKELVAQYKLEDSVFFIGFQENPFKYIAKSKIFVLPSMYEGFPNALAEAMACGVPVLSTDCFSGPREILAPDEFEKETISYEINTNRYGVLSPVFQDYDYNSLSPLTSEEEIMVRNLKELVESKELLEIFSQRSLERVSDFNINQVIKEWENLID